MAHSLRAHADGVATGCLQFPKGTTQPYTEHAKPTFKFALTPGNFYPDPYVRENGCCTSLNLRDQDDLKEYIEGSGTQTCSTYNNNNTNSLSNKMATSNSSGSNQTTNANGYQIPPMVSTAALPSKSAQPAFNIPPSAHLNNQMPSLMDSGKTTGRSTHSQMNPNPASMKLLAANQHSQGSVLPQQTQYNQYNTTQEMLMRGGYMSANEDIPGAPRAEQYGSQQRFVSTANETQLRGISRQTSSPFSQNYFQQDTHNSLAGSRNASSQPDERKMITKQQYQWPQQSRSQTAFGQANISLNPPSGANMSRTQIQVS